MDSKYFAVVSAEISHSELLSLGSLFNVYTLPPDHDIARPVQSHPDMIMSIVGNYLVVSSGYYEKNQSLIDRIAEHGNLSIVTSDMPRSSVYPHDIGLNTAVCGNFLICNKKYAAPEILRCAELCELTVVSVKQGYAGCSCIYADGLLITSDSGIYDEVSKNALSSVLVSNKGISLPGYNVGFIGGVGGFASGTFYFFGDISGMELESDIKTLAAEHGFLLHPLSDGPLTDRGGIKFIKYA